MQQDAYFITADFLYMFRASCAHHQECKILTRQFRFVPNMAKWGSTCNHNYLYRWLPCQYFILLMMGAWRPKHVEKVCGNKICILLHHVGVSFNLILWCTKTQNKKKVGTVIWYYNAAGRIILRYHSFKDIDSLVTPSSSLIWRYLCLRICITWSFCCWTRPPSSFWSDIFGVVRGLIAGRGSSSLSSS